MTKKKRIVVKGWAYPSVYKAPWQNETLYCLYRYKITKYLKKATLIVEVDG